MPWAPCVASDPVWNDTSGTHNLWRGKTANIADYLLSLLLELLDPLIRLFIYFLRPGQSSAFILHTYTLPCFLVPFVLSRR